MVEGKKISLKIESKVILENVSFQIKKKRITSFIGRSGAGKTSLLKCVSNINNNYSGSISLNQKDIRNLSNKERVQHIGFVSQNFNLFPHMTVLQNCTHPLTTVLKNSNSIANKKALTMLDSLEIKSLKNNFPSKLSGGQQQRVAIARALCMEPEIILLDEPTSALDPQNTKSLQNLIKQLKEQDITIALSSHDMPFVKNILDVIYFLENGKIVDQIDLQINSLPQKGFIHNFLSN
jgi:ABC-type polar amino acid transport system ATPase subunit